MSRGVYGSGVSVWGVHVQRGLSCHPHGSIKVLVLKKQGI